MDSVSERDRKELGVRGGAQLGLLSILFEVWGSGLLKEGQVLEGSAGQARAARPLMWRGRSIFQALVHLFSFIQPLSESAQHMRPPGMLVPISCLPHNYKVKKRTGASTHLDLIMERFSEVGKALW